MSSALEALKTKNQEAIIRYIGERKDEYTAYYVAFKKILHLFDNEDKHKIDATLAKADTSDAQVLEQLIDGPDNKETPRLLNQFLASFTEFRNLFVARLDARIDYLSNELLGSGRMKT